MTSLNKNNSNDNKENNDKKNDIPLSFASFYYSLKVTKGKGKVVQRNFYHVCLFYKK